MGNCISRDELYYNEDNDIELDELPLIELIASKNIRNEHLKDKIKMINQVIFTIYENEIKSVYSNDTGSAKASYNKKKT